MIDHVCWTDDTYCEDCGTPPSLDEAILNFLTAFEQTFGSIHKRNR